MSKEAFLEKYRPEAERAAKALNVPTSAVLAHWATETGFGKSIVPGTNNLGNIKDVSKAGTGTKAVDNETGTTDRYRRYESESLGTDDYISLIQRLHSGATNQTTAQGFAKALKKSGYFESEHGVSNITRIAGEKYDPTDVVLGPTATNVAATSAALRASIERPLARTEATRKLDLRMQYAQEDKEMLESVAPGVLMSGAAAMAGNTDSQLYGAFKDIVWGPKHAPEEGFVPDMSLLQKQTNNGADRDLIDDYAKAKSSAEAAEVLSRWEEENFRIKTVMANGKLTGVALSFAAELPTFSNLIPAVGAAKALKLFGVGSGALAAGGAGFGTVAKSAVAENILGGTAVEALRQGLTGDYSLMDLGLSVTVDAVFGLGAAGLAVRGGAPGLDINEAAGQAARREAKYAGRAEQELGEGATATEMRETMNRMFKEDIDAPNRGLKEEVSPENKLAAPEATEPAPSVKYDLPEADFDSLDKLEWRREDFSPGGKWADEVSVRTGGDVKDLAALEKLAPGVHVTGNFDVSHKPAYDTLAKLARQFVPGTRIVLHSADDLPINANGVKANADITQVTGDAAIIRIDPTLPASESVRAAVHEIGHAIFNSNIAKATPEQRAGLLQAFTRFVDEANSKAPDGDTARTMRFSLTNSNLLPDRELTTKLRSDYELDWDEFSAEQFAKFLDDDVQGENKLGLHANVVRMLKAAIANALEWLRFAKRQNLGVTDEYKEFFETLLNDPVVAAARVGGERKTLSLSQKSVPASPAAVVNEIQADPDAVKYGITIAPVATPAERKQAQAMIALHKQAEAWAAKNPKDAAWDKRAQNLADNSVFNVASIGLVMLKSSSPLTRMIASQLVEDASGVAGKHTATASINKELLNQKMMGRTVLDVEGAYGYWSKNKGGGIRDDLVGGKNRAEFNRFIAEEIENRAKANGPVTQDANIKAATDSIETGYQRIANAQRDADTLGSAGLPSTSRGYMPHKMNAKAVINMTNEQSRILHSALTDQFVGLGWDTSMADKVASQYMKRVRDRASGDYGSAVGGQRDGASQVEEALRAMDLPDDVVKSHMDKFNKGGASFTKKRIQLDLNKVYQTADGPFKLLDIFETNQIELLRSQAGRASGEVALTQWGVQGKPGLKLLRDAMEFGEDGKRAGNAEKEAFDQMAAEFMNEPFGTQAGKFMQRAMGANSLVRLGGLVYSQISETINGIVHVGAVRTAASVAAIPRLRGEIMALVRGEKVDNPFLTSIEIAGGAEFGTKEYKFVLPYDDPNSQYPTYGQDTLTLTDRLIRGAGHLQSKLSGWRYVHSAQQRGMAEQVVHKMMRYIREGNDDVALQQFGITPELRAQLRTDLNQIATFDNSGNLLRFDVTKITDPVARNATIQAVWRGTSQIIQGTYIGERGKWAHDGWQQLLTQFRTFSLVSMEKQWGRQRNSRGVAGAAGIVLGTMAMATPIYMARVYASSIGRPDQEAYIEERLQPQHMARATMNYVAGAGLAGDFVDLLTAPLPEDWGVKPTGGRAGIESDFVGNYVLPASSLVDDIWKFAQSPTELDDAVKVAPMSRLPYLVPFFNLSKD